MDRRMPEIADLVGPGACVIEFGSGSGLKTRKLLTGLDSPVAYVPVEISREHLLASAQALADEFLDLEVLPVCADFTQAFELPEPSHDLLGADLVDESDTFEVDGVAKEDYWKVVDQCYMCDLCYQTKCPYVPPHEWNLDFPHVMLRAKAVQFRKGERKISHKLLSNTKVQAAVGTLPVVDKVINASNRSKGVRKVMEKVLDLHPDAHLPPFHSDTLRRRDKGRVPLDTEVREAGPTRGKVALFATCYCNVNTPDIGQDIIKVFEHNGIPVRMTDKEECCGMPKLEQGDLETVEKYKKVNIPQLVKLIDEGWDIVAGIPSCVLMFKQELPLMYPDDADVLSLLMFGVPSSELGSGGAGALVQAALLAHILA